MELKHIAVDDLTNLEPASLVEIAKECDALKQSVRDELERQVAQEKARAAEAEMERVEALREAGLLSEPTEKTRKTKEERAAEKARKAEAKAAKARANGVAEQAAGAEEAALLDS